MGGFYFSCVVLLSFRLRVSSNCIISFRWNTKRNVFFTQDPLTLIDTGELDCSPGFQALASFERLTTKKRAASQRKSDKRNFKNKMPLHRLQIFRSDVPGLDADLPTYPHFLEQWIRNECFMHPVFVVQCTLCDGSTNHSRCFFGVTWEANQVKWHQVDQNWGEMDVSAGQASSSSAVKHVM